MSVMHVAFSLIDFSTVLMGEDNPAFEGLFEFCSISAGGSIGGFTQQFILSLTSYSTCRRSCGAADHLWGHRYRHQLGGWSASRQKTRSFGVLLHQRHCTRYSRTSTVLSTRVVHRHRLSSRRWCGGGVLYDG